MRPIRVLVTSAGRRVELVRCFRADAAALGLAVEILACDRDPLWSAACRTADRAFAVPPHGDAGYAQAVCDLCAREGVALLVPTVDPELEPLAAHRNAFRAVGAELAIGSAELVAIARDKLRTAQQLAAHGIPTPRTARIEEVLETPEDWAWPLFVKPRHGSAGRTLVTAHAPAELAAIPRSEPLIAQSLLRGEEYTINLFFDHQGVLRTAVPHWRRQVRAGEVEKAVTRRVPQLADIAHRMAAALPPARGVVCFQAMLDADGGGSVFEINARFGGGYPVAHRAGAAFSRWLLEEAAGLPSTAGDGWREGVVMLRYDAAVFPEP